MAAKSVVDVACEPLDAEIARAQNIIAALERSKDIIRQAHAATAAAAAEPKPRRTRGPNKHKRGLPNANAQPTTTGE